MYDAPPLPFFPPLTKLPLRTGLKFGPLAAVIIGFNKNEALLLLLELLLEAKGEAALAAEFDEVAFPRPPTRRIHSVSSRSRMFAVLD